MHVADLVDLSLDSRSYSGHATDRPASSERVALRPVVGLEEIAWLEDVRCTAQAQAMDVRQQPAGLTWTCYGHDSVTIFECRG